MLNQQDLPIEYLDSMKAQLGDEYESYIDTLSKRHATGLRINTLKTDADTLFNQLKMDMLERIPWTSCGYYTEDNMAFTRHPYYYAGLYYIQEPSAMTPVEQLHVQKQDRVLDLCAAPGGKSTQIASYLGPEGVLVTNDPSASRAKALLKNIELFGIKNSYITCEEPAKLSNHYVGYFDKILVDAPCSGEGMFRKDNAVLKAYKQRGPEFFAPIQREILEHAAKMLKPGGTLVYSTCTYSTMEDEGTINHFLETHDDFVIDPIKIEHGFFESHILPGSIKLFPHRLRGEGHFVCRLVKKGELVPDTNLGPNQGKPIDISKYKELAEFLNLLNIKLDLSRIWMNKEYVYYLPVDKHVVPDIHYIRTGLLLGRLKKERFEPSQAWAMALKSDEWKNPLNLKLDDERVLRYLKGETIDADDSCEGYRLVCVDGYPLGFVKQHEFRCKNKYYPGWRWM